MLQGLKFTYDDLKFKFNNNILFSAFKIVYQFFLLGLKQGCLLKENIINMSMLIETVNINRN